MQPTDYALGMPLVALGMILIVGGIVGLAWIFRYELGYDDGPEIPPVIEPDPDRTAIVSAVMPEPNYHRADDDTHVVPGIPGALPPAPTIFQISTAGTPDPWIAQQDWINAIAIPGLRVIPSPDLGPVCPFCGGPWHPNCPSAPKSAPDEEQTQVVDLCPLTTQDITVPFAEPAPAYRETFDDHPFAEVHTQELSGSLARAKESAA